ncbi:hydantoinase B/oxoprolinase family protein, partial [Natronospira sp.]
IISERRRRGPWGLAGGREGQAGRNHLNGRALPGKASFSVVDGDRLLLETPGGGAWGDPGPA